MRTKLTIIICAFAFFFQKAKAQIITFNKDFGYTDSIGTWRDGALGVFALSDSTYFVLSFSEGLQAAKQPLVVTKLNKHGVVTFEHIYGQDSSVYYAGQQGTIIKIIGNQYAVAGNRYSNDGDSYATLWKFSSDGDSLLEKEYGSSNADTLDNFCDLVQLSDSGFMMVGWSETNVDSFQQSQWNVDLLLIRTDENGNEIWEKRIDYSFGDEGLHIESFDSTHVIVSGFKKAFTGTVDIPWIFVADLQGNIVKERSFPDPPYNCWWLIGPRLFSSIDGNFFLTGCLNGALQTGYYNYPEYIAKLDTDLNFIWEKDFNAQSIQYIWNVHQFEDSSILIVGEQDTLGASLGWVSKLKPNGDTEWSKLYKHQGSFFNLLWSIDQTYDCGYIVSGTTHDTEQNSWILKMDKYGCINPVCDTVPTPCGGGIITNVGSQEVSTLKLDMDIYPSLATDKLSIFYNLPEGSNTAQLQIINLNGQEIFTQRITRGMHTVDLEVSNWAPGMYVCEITTATQQIAEKVFVTK